MFFLCLSYTIYLFRAHPHWFYKSSYSRLLAMKDARSCLERPVKMLLLGAPLSVCRVLVLN